MKKSGPSKRQREATGQRFEHALTVLELCSSSCRRSVAFECLTAHEIQFVNNVSKNLVDLSKLIVKYSVDELDFLSKQCSGFEHALAEIMAGHALPSSDPPPAVVDADELEENEGA